MDRMDMALLLEALAIVSGRLVGTGGALSVNNCRHWFRGINCDYLKLPLQINYMHVHVTLYFNWQAEYEI